VPYYKRERGRSRTEGPRAARSARLTPTCLPTCDGAGVAPVVEGLAPRHLDHGGGEIDTGEAIDLGPEGRAGKPGPATDIEHAGKLRRTAGGSRHRRHRRDQQLRAAIIEMLQHARIESRGVLIEQPPDMGLHHGGRGFAQPEPGQAQASPVEVLRIGSAGGQKGRDGALPIALGFADRPEREPGARKGRSGLQHLLENLRRGGPLPAGEVIQRPLVAPVGDQIAGGEQERNGLHDIAHCGSQPGSYDISMANASGAGPRTGFRLARQCALIMLPA